METNPLRDPRDREELHNRNALSNTDVGPHGSLGSPGVDTEMEFPQADLTPMNRDFAGSPPNLQSAIADVEHSNRQLEMAFDHLKEKVDSTMVSLERTFDKAKAPLRYVRKNPLSLTPVLFLGAFFIGRLLGSTMAEKRQEEELAYQRDALARDTVAEFHRDEVVVGPGALI